MGRAQWLKDNGVAEDFLKSVDLNEAEGWSLIFVARDHRCIGWVGLQDQVRAEAKVALAELKEAGVRRIAMVSGDRQVVATRVAAEIGCEEAKGDCLPQNKVEFVRAMKAKGYKVAVIGDGVNDAPALAAGDLGIAMGAAGSEVAIHSATIALMNNDLQRLPFLVKLSRSTRAVINQNFAFGICFIIAGLVGVGVRVHRPGHRRRFARHRHVHRDFQQRAARAQRRGTGAFPSRSHRRQTRPRLASEADRRTDAEAGVNRINNVFTEMTNEKLIAKALEHAKAPDLNSKRSRIRKCAKLSLFIFMEN